MFEFITVRELYELYINDRDHLMVLNMLNYKDGSVQIEIVGKSDF